MVSRPMSAPRTRPAPGPTASNRPAPQATYCADEDSDTGVTHDLDIGDDDADDEDIDLDSYEAYLAEIQRKAKSRPQSAYTLRPYPSESPEFYMVTTANPVTPLDLSTITKDLRTGPQSPGDKQQPGQRMPVRPVSARPRVQSSDGNRQGVSVVPRAPQTARPTTASSGGGSRRKRQAPTDAAGEPLSAHIRAVYSDISGRGRGRGGALARDTGGTSSSSSHTASTVIQSRLRVFEEAELQHEYHRLVDVVADLRTVVQHEQTQRIKAMARVRRLEEIVSLKDKKIDALLRGQSLGLHSNSGVGAVDANTVLQREMAQRERQHHAMMQKLRHKLAQQTQLVASYEEAMQALRASIKSTRLLEMEQEIEQLQLENSALHGALVALSEEVQLYAHHVAELKAGDAHLRAQLSKSHQELKRSDHERRKLEHETLFFKASVDQLEQKLALEQKKRAYDHVVAMGKTGTPRKSPLSKSPRVASASPRPTSTTHSPPASVEESAATASLAEALAEIRTLRAPMPTATTAGNSSPLKQRRPTPMPACKPPPSPTSSEDEGSVGEDVGVVDLEGRVLEDEEHRTEGPGRLGALKKPQARRDEVVNGRKRVRWSEEDVDKKVGEEERQQEETLGGYLQDGNMHMNVEPADAITVECGNTDDADEDQIGGGNEDHQHRIDYDQHEEAKRRQEPDQLSHEHSPSSDNSTRGQSRTLSDSATNDETGWKDAEDEDAESKEGGLFGEGTRSRDAIDSHESHLGGVSLPDTTSETSLSRSSSSDRSPPSELGGPPSSSGSSSLSSLIAREDAAIMAAQETAEAERAPSDDSDTSEGRLGASPDRELAYDSDFSDNDSV